MGSPSFTQVTYRFRNDDNNEASATWKKDQDTNISQKTGTNFRVRFLIDETASRSWTSVTWNLYYSQNGGAYTAVSTTTPVKFSASSQFADGADCTSQLTGGTGTFVTDNNGMKETTGGATNSGTAGQYFDTEWCLQLDATQVADGDTIALRIYNGTSAIAAYTATPTIYVYDTTLEQKQFRGRDDTQTLNSSTFSQSLNTNWTQPLDTVFRIRFTIQETAGNNPANRDYTLYTSYNSGAYSPISATTAGSSTVYHALSSQYANGDATTQVLSGTGTFTGGVGREGSSVAATVNLAASGNTELEWALVLDSTIGATNGDTFAFRVYSVPNGISISNDALDTYTVTPTVTAGAAGTNLVPADVSSTSQADNVALTQVHNVVMADASATTQADNVALTQAHNLIVADGSATTQADNVDLVQATNLVAADVSSVTQADNVALTQVHNLTVADGSATSQADAVTLAQVHNLIPADVSSTTQADNVTIVITTDLVVADVSSTAQADNVALTQVHNLIVADASAVSQADSVTLTQTHNLSVADGSATTQADNIDLSGSVTLEMADGSATTQADNVTLTQVHNLVVGDGFATTHADAIDLSGSVTLEIADGFAVSQADSVIITQTHVLGIADAASVTQADNVDLTQTYVLAIADGSATAQADNIDLAQVHNLVAADAYSVTSAPNVTITDASSTLIIADGYSETYADAVVILKYYDYDRRYKASARRDVSVEARTTHEAGTRRDQAAEEREDNQAKPRRTFKSDGL